MAGGRRARQCGAGLASVAALFALCAAGPALGQATGGSGGAAAGGAPAGGVGFQPLVAEFGVTARQEFIQNYGFGNQNTWITSVGPTASLRMDSEVLKLSANASISANRFSNEQAGRGSTGTPRFGLSASYQQERSTYGLNIAFSRDRSFAVFDPSSPGFVLTQAQRQNFSFSPTYSYAITERLSANANYAYSSSTLSQPTPGLFDFTNQSVGTGLSYRLTPLDTVTVSLSSGRSRTSPDSTSSDTRSLSFGWLRPWSETLSTSFNVGLNHSDQSSRVTQTLCPVPIQFCQFGLVPFTTVQGGSQSKTNSTTFGGTLSYQYDSETGFVARASRDVLPSIGGALTTRDSFGVSASRRLTELLTSSFDAGYTKSAFTGSTAASTTTLQSMSARIGYEFIPTWNLDAGVSWTRAEFTTSTPTSKAFFVSVSKRWPGYRVWP
jgi:hypothetical protein